MASFDFTLCLSQQKSILNIPEQFYRSILHAIYVDRPAAETEPQPHSSQTYKVMLFE